MHLRLIILQLILLSMSYGLYAQTLTPTSTEAVVTLKIQAAEGGVFAGQQVSFTPKSGGSAVKATSDAKGVVEVLLPIGQEYNIQVGNMPDSRILKVPDQPNMMMNMSIAYPRNALEKAKNFQMSEVEKAAIDKFASTLPDTTEIRSSATAPTAESALLTIRLVDMEGQPLVDESFILVGRNRKKAFKAKTNSLGTIAILIPKGDIYSLNFKHHPDYEAWDCPYVKGNHRHDWTIHYLGTKEIERLEKERAERLAAEKKRLEEERKAFEEYARKESLSILEARKREIEKYMSSLEAKTPEKAETVEKDEFGDPVILNTLNRNQWQDKLIVCDLTGSMAPYHSQLLLWYTLNHMKEQNLQFVFFNDGDNMPDHLKEIGSTGGIYHSPSKGIDSLHHFMAYVASMGYGGDCPENNIEALIKGTAQAKPYKELVMIVDNHSPVKDIALLEKFNVPVRIILCGVNGYIEPDYLRIAWKTKGSIHTIEEDIVSIASLVEGQEIIVQGLTYVLVKGKFYPVKKS